MTAPPHPRKPDLVVDNTTLKPGELIIRGESDDAFWFMQRFIEENEGNGNLIWMMESSDETIAQHLPNGARDLPGLLADNDLVHEGFIIPNNAMPILQRAADRKGLTLGPPAA